MFNYCDSINLAEEISRRAVQHGLVMDILAEINIGGEETKGGITPESAPEFGAQLRELPGVRLRGLMPTLVVRLFPWRRQRRRPDSPLLRQAKR